jgi:site-specific recombinase XerD
MDLTTLCDLFCAHATHFRGCTPATIKRYRTDIRVLQNLQRVRTLEECTPTAIRAFFLHGRTERQWKSATYRTYHQTFKVFFRWCRTEGYLQADPIGGLEVPRLERSLPARLTLSEAQRLLECAANAPRAPRFERSRNHALLAVALHAGLRRSELLHLTLSDVDLEGQSIFVRQGKGSKDRYVPVNAALLGILERYLTERRRVGKFCPSFFTSVRHDAALSHEGLRKTVIGLRRLSRLRFRLHGLRHTFATLMLEGGCDIYSLSRLMGHSDIKTTTIYLAASSAHLRAQVAMHPLGTLESSSRAGGISVQRATPGSW